MSGFFPNNTPLDLADHGALGEFFDDLNVRNMGVGANASPGDEPPPPVKQKILQMYTARFPLWDIPVYLYNTNAPDVIVTCMKVILEANSVDKPVSPRVVSNVYPSVSETLFYYANLQPADIHDVLVQYGMLVEIDAIIGTLCNRAWHGHAPNVWPRMSRFVTMLHDVYRLPVYAIFRDFQLYDDFCYSWLVRTLHFQRPLSSEKINMEVEADVVNLDYFNDDPEARLRPCECCFVLEKLV